VQKGKTPNVFLAVGADWQENSLPKRRKSVAYSTYNAYRILFVYYRTVPRFPLWVPMTHVPYRCHVVTHHTSILLTLMHSQTHIDKVASFPVSNLTQLIHYNPPQKPFLPVRAHWISLIVRHHACAIKLSLCGFRTEDLPVQKGKTPEVFL
jgi:hypothetical protein